MDDMVLKAMARWPDVPVVYGWLSLTRRGRWLIRGEAIANQAAVAFIGRNYQADEAGNWYFQNGPQRVYVALEYTPWVLRLRGDGSLETHTGNSVCKPERAYLDEQGNLLIAFEAGIGLVEDRDLEALSYCLRGAHGDVLDPDQALEELAAIAAGANGSMALHVSAAVLTLKGLDGHSVPGRFGFIPRPGPPDVDSE